ncbi:MAG: AMP-binding protein [Clostridia bacterium]|nr:AMP-binding protein [Clostridia bacterium]
MKSDILHARKEFTNVRELVEWAADTHGEKIAFSFKETPSSSEIKKIDFIKLRDDVRALASSMLQMGCSGKHCVIIGKFSYQWVVTYFAALSIGAVLVPLDRDWLADDLADTAMRADMSFLFCDEDVSEKAKNIAAKAKLSSPVVYLLAKKEENSLSSLIEAGYEKFHAARGAYFNTLIDPMRLSLLVFTSGTTGKGKGVMLSQNAILSDISAVIPYIDFADKTVGVLPPHHTYGSSTMIIGHVMIGAEVYISSGLRYIQKELKEQKPGHLVLVPLYLETFYRKILATIKEKGKEDVLRRMIKLSNNLRKTGVDVRRQLFGSIRSAFGGEIKMIVSGGAPINPEIISFFEAIGISTINGYGITECAPIVAFNRSRRIVHGSVGNVIDIDTVKIDEPNEDGEGEICVKGPNVMLGYYKDNEATADAIDKDGYFKTGDYGKMTDEGILYITGRKKNLIILSNGKNVYPEEIENELVATPGVLDIIVYEGSSKRGMEHNAIVAEIYPDKEYIEKNGITDIKAHLKAYIDEYNKGAVPYKKIGVLKVREEEFPKNTLRKIMRFKLDTSIE